jgi:hypothetical protein
MHTIVQGAAAASRITIPFWIGGGAGNRRGEGKPETILPLVSGKIGCLAYETGDASHGALSPSIASNRRQQGSARQAMRAPFGTD